MPDYTVKISEEGDRVIQLAYTTENARLGADAYASVDDFLTAQIVHEFGVSDDELAALAAKAVVDQINEKLTGLTPEQMAPILDAATTAASQQPPKPPKNP